MNIYMPADKQNQAEDTMGKEYDFKTVAEAEEYYFSNFASTNNMHDEETPRLERWLDNQSIEELEDENA